MREMRVNQQHYKMSAIIKMLLAMSQGGANSLTYNGQVLTLNGKPLSYGN